MVIRLRGGYLFADHHLNPSIAYLALLTTPRTLCMMLVFRPRPELGGAEK